METAYKLSTSYFLDKLPLPNQTGEVVVLEVAAGEQIHGEICSITHKGRPGSSTSWYVFARNGASADLCCCCCCKGESTAEEKESGEEFPAPAPAIEPGEEDDDGGGAGTSHVRGEGRQKRARPCPP
ncbi:hypothetical protein SAY87_022651 [Trapa incisa]|uniref:Uncharacterized protein n=1 Tax=Trapa incisa TaxID=236973 RepID=A0AAN7KAJ2_9MYRT|nr:hypothetical protein SAY87_022651 [Trapa incisa]